jgi:hypothetical protein
LSSLDSAAGTVAARQQRVWVVRRTRALSSAKIGDLGADMWALATVTGSGGLNTIRFQIQTDSNQVRIVSNFDQSKNGLPELQKIEMKYGFEDLEKMITFSIETPSNSEGIFNKILGKSRSVFEFRKLIKIARNGLKI